MAKLFLFILVTGCLGRLERKPTDCIRGSWRVLIARSWPITGYEKAPAAMKTARVLIFSWID